MRKGAGGFTLCERCNNDTGQWYVPAYVDWAHQGMRFALAGGSSLDLPFRVFPGRIAKQIVCMFASANGAGFVRNAPELRKYVLDKDARGIPPRFRLYCYLMSPKSRASRQTGVVARFRGSGFDLLSEIAFRPFGYVMTFDQQAAPERGLTDITFFTHHAAGDYRELHLPMPLREVQTYFPTDFRTDAEWKQAKASAQRDHDADAEQNSDK